MGSPFHVPNKNAFTRCARLFLFWGWLCFRRLHKPFCM